MSGTASKYPNTVGVRPVIVQDYDASWPAEFEKLRDILTGALGDTALAIEHVGSTSVPGLAAKPVLDIDVVVKRHDMATAIGKLATLGYVHTGNQGVEDREALKQTGEWYPHHLYVCPEDSAELARHVAFRDLLRNSPELCQRYEQLKKHLAEIHRNDRVAYTEGKSAFIQRCLAGLK